MFADGLLHLAHLHERNTTLVMASHAPLAAIKAVTSRMSWTMPWVGKTMFVTTAYRGERTSG
ncbi:MAG: DUF899 family protein [Paracoccaceae bacterium]|nr:DUF899 family protein [Paracoccaceae bacterium]